MWMQESIVLACLLSCILFDHFWGAGKKPKRKIPWNFMFMVVAYKWIKFAGELRLQLATVKQRKQASKTQPYLVLDGNLVKTCHGTNVRFCDLQSNLKTCQHSERVGKGDGTGGSGGEVPRCGWLFSVHPLEVKTSAWISLFWSDNRWDKRTEQKDLAVPVWGDRNGNVSGNAITGIHGKLLVCVEGWMKCSCFCGAVVE